MTMMPLISAVKSALFNISAVCDDDDDEDDNDDNDDDDDDDHDDDGCSDYSSLRIIIINDIGAWQARYHCRFEHMLV